MTRDQWYGTEHLRAGLAQILNTPELREAITLLKDEMEPRASEVATVNPTVAAALYNQRIGYYSALRDLAALAREERKPKTVKPLQLESPQ